VLTKLAKILPIKRSLLLAPLLFLALDIALELYYIFYITDYFSFYGFNYKLNIIKAIETKFWLVAFILSFLLLQRKSNFLGAIALILGLLVLIPNSIMYSYSDGSRLVYYSVITFFAFALSVPHIKIKIPKFQVTKDVQLYILVGLSILFLIPILIDFGLNIHPKVLFLQDIYEVRAIYKTNLSLFSAYTFGWLSKAVLPILIIFGIIHKKYIFSIFAFVIILYLYLLSAHKTIYFTPVLILIYYFLGNSFMNKVNLTFIGLLGVFAIIPFADIMLDSNMFRGIIVRRIFFIPSLLNEYYFEFFAENPIYLSHSIFKSFSEYPFPHIPPKMIGLEYYGDAKANINNGLVSDGFMNFGYWGVVALSVSFGLLLAFINSIKVKKEYFGIFVFYIFTFVSGSFLTVLLTHGFGLILLFSLIIFRQENEDSN